MIKVKNKIVQVVMCGIIISIVAQTGVSATDYALENFYVNSGNIVATKYYNGGADKYLEWCVRRDASIAARSSMEYKEYSESIDYTNTYEYRSKLSDDKTIQRVEVKFAVMKDNKYIQKDYLDRIIENWPYEGNKELYTQGELPLDRVPKHKNGDPEFIGWFTDKELTSQYLFKATTDELKGPSYTVFDKPLVQMGSFTLYAKFKN